MGPKELDIKLQEFEIRLAIVNKDLQELIKTAKDIEDRANAILGKSKWLSAFGAIAFMTRLSARSVQIVNQTQTLKR